jgi:hypothetical protein
MLCFDHFYFVLACTLDRRETKESVPLLETEIHCNIYECNIVGLPDYDCYIYLCVILTLLWLAIIDFTSYLEI